MILVRGCEAAAELLIYAIVVFGPWAFGTTQSWSIWVMNGMAYAVGVLWLGSKAAGKMIGYRPQTQPEPGACGSRTFGNERGCMSKVPVGHFSRTFGRMPELSRWATKGLGILTIVLLSYCLISAINPRAVYLAAEEHFEYHDCILWLPHSFDSTSTWRAFWTYLALASWFWVICDWLRGQTSSELKKSSRSSSAGEQPLPPFPARLNRLLWLLCVNGAALGLESIVQREAQCPKLLFLVQPQIHREAASQFGPFAYRANGAEYFNLIWPVCIGFWWTLTSYAKPHKSRHLLLACATVIAACPLISTSRGGALVALGLLLASAGLFLVSRIAGNPALRGPSLVALSIFVLGALALGFWLGWARLKPRLATIREGFEDRARICGLAEQMAHDHAIYGTGPGTYEAVSELYRPNDTDFWPAQVHNDWLETRITFGIAGCLLLAVGGSLAVLRSLLSATFHAGKTMMPFIWFALAGCLLHARYDFPFQVHSILTLFVTLGAVLYTLSYQRRQRDSVPRAGAV